MMLNNFAISFSLLFYCLCCPLPGVAQDRFLGKYCLGEDADPSSIVELPDGYVVTGGTCYNAETDDELIAFKVDKQGNFRWRCGIKPLNPWFVGCSIVAYEGGLAPDGTVMIGGGAGQGGAWGSAVFGQSGSG